MEMVKNILLSLGLTFFLALSVPSNADDVTNVYVGLNLSGLYQRNNGNEELTAQRDQSLRLGFELGFAKHINDRWNIGSGIELLPEQSAFKNIAGSVLMWRMVELEYKLSRRWSTGGYFGLGRYFRENPGYGYGAGWIATYQLSEKWYVDITANLLGTSTGLNQEGFRLDKDVIGWGGMGLRYRF